MAGFLLGWGVDPSPRNEDALDAVWWRDEGAL